MTWQLEIHHIDVVGAGDSTLVIACEVPRLMAGALAVQSGVCFYNLSALPAPQWVTHTHQ